MRIISAIFFLTSLFFIAFSINLEAQGAKMENQNNSDRSWFYLWSDGFEIHLLALPHNIGLKEIFRTKTRADESIGYRYLSGDSKKVSFTLGVQGRGLENYDGLYIVDVASSATKKVIVCPRGNITLIGFADYKSVLLSGYLYRHDGEIIYQPKDGDNMEYVYRYDFIHDDFERLSDLGPATLWISNGKAGSSLLAYKSELGFKVYDLDQKTTNEVVVGGDLSAISPSGKKILFLDEKEGYFLIDSNGRDRKLVLNNKRMRAHKPFFVGYFEIRFMSWSPDGRYILFQESSDQNAGKKYLLDLETDLFVPV